MSNLSLPSDNTQRRSRPGRVFYDGECAFCRALVDRLSPPFRRRGFSFEPLRSVGVAEALGYRSDSPELLAEMRLLTADGRIYGGADAVLHLIGRIAWLRPLAWIGSLPGAKQILRAAYRRVAARRSCRGNACDSGAPISKVDRFQRAACVPGANAKGLRRANDPHPVARTERRTP